MKKYLISLSPLVLGIGLLSSCIDAAPPMPQAYSNLITSTDTVHIKIMSYIGVTNQLTVKTTAGTHIHVTAMTDNVEVCINKSCKVLLKGEVLTVTSGNSDFFGSFPLSRLVDINDWVDTNGGLNNGTNAN